MTIHAVVVKQTQGSTTRPVTGGCVRGEVLPEQPAAEERVGSQVSSIAAAKAAAVGPVAADAADIRLHHPRLLPGYYGTTLGGGGEGGGRRGRGR